MKILINDLGTNEDTYRRLFGKFGYERNELIFCSSFVEAKEFIINNLEQRKLHIDLIISDDYSQGVFQATKLCQFKNSLISSYSNNNFRINSIPFILYTEKRVTDYKYSNVVNKNIEYFDVSIKKFEEQIKNWRSLLKQDIEILGLSKVNLRAFYKAKNYTDYKNRVLKNSFDFFCCKTKIVSKEFINNPYSLNYDWYKTKPTQIEQRIENLNKTYTEHIKYDRKNNERTIIHKYFNENQETLLRGGHDGIEYEKKLMYANSNNNEECDYILKTDFPDYANTTLLEVKKEDVKFYVKKNSRRPQFSADFTAHLLQIWGYKKYVNDLSNQHEINRKLGYYPKNNYDFTLLAGRIEEKEEMKELMEEHLERMYNGINVLTYEELEKINEEYYKRFIRLR